MKLKPEQIARAKPIHAASYRRRMARIEDHIKTGSPMMRIPAIAVMEMTMALQAYHGGRWRCLRVMFRAEFLFWRHEMYGRIIIGLCDFMGWTKLYDLPGSTKEMPMKMRHGRKCSGSPNCNDMDCIERSLPRWFFWLTKWYWNV